MGDRAQAAVPRSAVATLNRRYAFAHGRGHRLYRGMIHREEATWTIRIEAAAEFDETYDGDLDGYAWRNDAFREIQQRATQAVLRALAATPGWRVRTGN